MNDLSVIPGSSNDANAQLEVLFIHGITGSASETWKVPASKFWPEWLAGAGSGIATFAVEYPAPLTSWFGAGSGMTLPERGRQVLSYLRSVGRFNKPTVIVAHSLGGLLSKQMLRIAAENGLPEYQSIVESTKAVVFLATPHAGSNLATVMRLFQSLGSEEVEGLEAHNPYLADLAEWYRNRAAAYGIETYAYREDRKTGGVWVVDPTSADPRISGVIVIPADENHQSIAKAHTPTSPIAVGISAIVTSVMQRLTSQNVQVDETPALDSLRLLFEIESHVATSVDAEPEFIRLVLRTLVERGYLSARYYEVAMDPASNRSFAFLREFIHSQQTAVLPLGLPIPLESSTLLTLGGPGDIAFGDGKYPHVGAADWVKPLQLENERWVDIGIWDVHRKRDYVLAISRSQEQEFGADARVVFRVLRGIIEGFYAKHRARKSAHLTEVTAKFFASQANRTLTPRDIAELIGDIALKASDGAVCTVFQYSWATRRLQKLAEHYSDGSPADGVEENICCGQFLTGNAWQNPQIRHVPDLESYLAAHPQARCGESFNRLESRLGGLNSALFSVVGTKHLRFMVRVVNRVNSRTVPLGQSQKLFLDESCELLTEFVDNFATESLVREFANLSTAIRKNHGQTKAAAACAKSFHMMGVDSTSIFFHPQGGRNLELLHCEDANLRSQLSADSLEVVENGLAATLLGKIGVRHMRAAEIRVLEDDALRRALLALGAKSVIVITAQGEFGSVMALRVSYEADWVGTATDLAGGTDREALCTFLQMLGRAVEAYRSTVSTDVADRLVAHFGHEVATPLAKLQNKAIAAVNLAISSLVGDEHGKRRNQLAETKMKIDSISHQVSRQMESAIALANQTFGRIELDCKHLRWKDIADEAWTEALSWAEDESGGKRKTARSVILEKNPAVEDMMIVADPTLLHAILANLFKNAIKYSLPRYRNVSMKVRLLGQPQIGWHIVQVENWGIGIPPEEFEQIFQRYHRFERVDRVRAIRGLGLGLYISRLYAKAHGGRLLCRESSPTLDDPSRRWDFEGYLTKFELCIPQNIPIGTSGYNVGGT